MFVFAMRFSDDAAFVALEFVDGSECGTVHANISLDCKRRPDVKGGDCEHFGCRACKLELCE